MAVSSVIRSASACLALVLSALVALPLAQDGPASARTGTKRFDARVVTSGLEGPWELTLGPDGMLWVTERQGRRITRVDPTTGARHVAATLTDATTAGGAEGVLGLALHPDLLKGVGRDHVFVAQTYIDRSLPPDPRISDPASPWRHLYSKIVRLTFDAASGTLRDAVDMLTGLPAGNDHAGLRIAISPDRRLHVTIGDQGNNQLGNFCKPVLAQRLPTAEEIARRDFIAYEGKTLRMELDGSIPADNPRLGGVVSHVYTVGHRNPQGLVFGPDGTLYSSEHGPKTDDEVNVLVSGGNYGWPHVAGRRDDQAYVHARWAESTVPCETMRFSDITIPSSVPQQAESQFRDPMVEPLATLFTVPTGTDFQDPVCKGVDFICWPTVAPSSLAYYGGYANGIPGWDRVLLVPTLKHGSLYVVPLDASGRALGGPIVRELRGQSRYRDIAISPDGRTLYIATDPGGLVEARSGGATTEVEYSGAIVAFTYAGEDATPVETMTAAPPPTTIERMPAGSGIAPTITAAQVAAGKTAYEARCAVCHGNTLTNGTFATPLAGAYFARQWSGRSVAPLFAKSHDTMPPTAPRSLPPETYASIVAYVLEVNGVATGPEPLPPGGAALERMRIP